jgi:hypothetical protein
MEVTEATGADETNRSDLPCPEATESNNKVPPDLNLKLNQHCFRHCRFLSLFEYLRQFDKNLIRLSLKTQVEYN